MRRIMSKIQKAYEARRQAVEAHNTIADSVEERGEKSAEDEASLSKADAEIRATTEALEAAIAADEQEKRYAAAFERAGVEPRVETRGEPTPFEIEAAEIAKIAAGEARSMVVKPKSFGRVETRAALDTDASRGGDTVPTSMFSRVIDGLREFSTVVQAGAEVVTTSGGEEITVPKVSTVPAAALVAEGGTFGASDSTFDAVALNAYKYGFISQASMELLADSAFNMAAEVGRLGGEAIGLGTGVHFVAGTGTAQPEGVLQGTNGTAFAGTDAITADELIGVVHGVSQPYRPGSVFIMNDSTVEYVRKLKDLDGNYIWRAGLSAGQPDTLLGYPVFSDPNMPEIATGNETVVFGNLGRGLLVRMAGGVRIERSDEYAWAEDLVSWKFAVRMDSVIKDTNAFRVYAQA